MRTMEKSFAEMVASVPADIKAEVDMEFAISNRIYDLMTERGLSKSEFAKAMRKRPSEVTKWLSGQHNFTIRTLASISTFFGEPLVRL